MGLGRARMPVASDDMDLAPLRAFSANIFGRLVPALLGSSFLVFRFYLST